MVFFLNSTVVQREDSWQSPTAMEPGKDTYTSCVVRMGAGAWLYLLFFLPHLVVSGANPGAKSLPPEHQTLEDHSPNSTSW